MNRGPSEALWRLLKPEDKKFSPFSLESGTSWSFDDFMENDGYVTKGDEAECGWTPFARLQLASNLNITESTRIVVEGRFRPIEKPAILLLSLKGTRYFSVKHRVTETVKFGLAMDGKLRMGFTSVNGVVTADGWDYNGPAQAMRVECVAIDGDLECDWLACAEVQI